MRYYFQGKYGEGQKFVCKIEKFSGINAATDEDVLPISCAKYGYNVRIGGGVLKEGYGVDYAKINNRYVPSMGPTGEGIKKVFLYKRFDRTTGLKDDRIIVYSDNDTLYEASVYTSRTFAELQGQLGTDNLTLLNCEYNGKDCLWICDDDGHLMIYDGLDLTTVANTPKFTDACVYNGRVYAAADSGSNVLRFSAENDPTQWNEEQGAGKVSFPDEGGKIIRVVVFKEGLIVFREHSVYKYVSYPGSKTYTLTKIFLTEQKIYPKSVCVCGRKLIFLTGSGFYSYDGSLVTAIWRDVFPIVSDKRDCSAAFFDNKYFLTFYMDMGGEIVGEESSIVKNNAFLAIDVDTGEISITRGTDVGEFIPVEYKGESKLLCAFSYGYRVFDIGMVTETGKVFSTSLKKLWAGPKTTLSMLGDEKYVRKIYLRSIGDLTLRVETDRTEEYDLPASSRNHCIIVGRKGDAVGLTLTSTADKITVFGMEIEFEIKRRGFYDR